MKSLLLIFCFFIAVHSFGQRSFFGADAGINLANQKTTLASSSIVLRPSFGAFYQFGISEKFATRINAQYMGMGYSSGPLGDLSINYLTFPVAIHFAANKKLSFNGGAYLSFTIGGTNINNNEITKTYHKNDNGFYFGGEYDLTKNIAVSFNYYIGTKNIWLDDQGGTIELTNQAFQFLLVYKFKKPS